MGRIAAHGRRRERPQRHDALLVALAQTTQQAALEVDVGAAQGDDLAGPQAAAVEKLEQGEVALGERPRRRHGGEDGLDLVDPQHPGQALGMLGRGEMHRRIGHEAVFAHEVVIEAADRRHAARHAGGRAVAPRPVEVAVEVVVGRRGDAAGGR